MHKWVAIAICGLFLAPGGATAQSENNLKPIEPGGVRITTRAPESDNWDARSGANGTRIFVCKTLACPDPAAVTITISKTLARHPDPKALEKYAKVDLPKQTRAAAAAAAVIYDGAIKFDTLASRVTQMKGFRSVINETKISGPKQATYLHSAILFSGPLMVNVICRTVNRELARKSLYAFVEAMTIIEGPPLALSVPTAPPPAIESKTL